MSTEARISPAFEPFLAGSNPSDKHEAIVVYRAPQPPTVVVRGRLRRLQERLRAVEAQAVAQRDVKARVLSGYLEASSKRMPSNQSLAVSEPTGGPLPVVTVEVTRRTLPTLARQPDVVAVLPNQKVHLIRPTSVDYATLVKEEASSGLTWGLRHLDIPALWSTTRGEEINVAVLDTGVHADHPALANRVREFVVIDPLGRRVTASPPFDCGTHGTHVCGTIAGGKTLDGVAIGVAPAANVLVAGVLIGDATVQTVIAGLNWAVERGADIINMSLGFPYFEPRFDQIFSVLLDYGILPVVAIGNENHGNSSSPGNADHALSVGALEPMGKDKVEVAFFSSGASLVFPGQEPSALVTKPDVVAPGVQVYSCIPPQTQHGDTFAYSYMGGTSMATPHVAGVAALLMAAHPTAPVADIIRVLRETARHPAGANRRPDNRWGYGQIRPLDALQALA